MAIDRIFHIIPMSNDLPALKAQYNDVFGVGRGFQDDNYTRGEKGDASGALLGDTVVQLSRPNTRDSMAATDMEANKEIHHAAAFRVQHLDATHAYVGTKGTVTLDRDKHTLITDPTTTHGGLFRWTTWDIPGGIRDASVLVAQS